MNRILSLIVTILFALCIEAGIFMLIAHWWGMTAAITVIAIECVLALSILRKTFIDKSPDRYFEFV